MYSSNIMSVEFKKHFKKNNFYFFIFIGLHLISNRFDHMTLVKLERTFITDSI